MPRTSSQAPRDPDPRRQRRRKTHHRIDSNGELLANYDRSEEGRESPPQENRTRRSDRERRKERPSRSQSRTTTTVLSAEQLARLDKQNNKQGWSEYDRVPQAREYDDETRAEHDSDVERERREVERERRRKREERRRKRRQEAGEPGLKHEHPKDSRRKTERYDRHERRIASGQRLERGGGTYYSDKEEYREDVRRKDSSDISLSEEEVAARKKKRKRNVIIAVILLVVALLIIIPVAVVVSRKNSGGGSSTTEAGAADGASSKPANTNLDGMSENDIPPDARGTVLDPFTWYDTLDFNVTYTAQTVGGLSVMGLNSTWDDNTRANDQVPPLNETFDYGTMPIRGINMGGWLSIEPFITPSLFDGFNTHDGVVDEWTLSAKLGPATAKSTIEKHYSQWVQESTFQQIQAAGFDHIRMPYSYWAVTTYPGDPYVPQVSWRYLLRGIEWARKYGLRINLDLHGAPGSQNGWNHSGRQGLIRWLNGTDGALNGNRTIEIHKQLATFFSQDRYKNLVTMYGLVNEPRMVELDPATVIAWTSEAFTAVRDSGFNGIVIFGDGFMGLDKWQGVLQGLNGLLLDVHQYVIFNVEQIVLDHHDKINFACGGWTAQTLRSENKATGFGPTLCGEWSQADTDCAEYLNNVGVGSRWEGTLNMAFTPGGSSDGSILSPTCPTHNNPRCSCGPANADPEQWSQAYKQWLLTFAEAQMYSFEQGWGWFYWTWKTESAAQWSYQDALAAGTMPKVAYERSFNCGAIPDFEGLPENY